MARGNETPAGDNAGEGRRDAGRNDAGRPNNDRGEKKIFNIRNKYDRGAGREGGERSSYSRDRREGGERRSFGDDRAPRESRDRDGGERRPFNSDRREGGERRSFGSDRRGGGERRSFGNDRREDGAKRPFTPRRENGERKPFSSDRREEGNDKRSFGNDRREGGERRSFGSDRPGSGYKKPYDAGRRDEGERRSFGANREERDGRKSYGDRREAGERRSFGSDRPSREGRDSSARKSFNADRSERPSYGDRSESSDRKPYNDRREGSERRSFGNDRSEGSEKQPFNSNRPDRREGGEQKPFAGRLGKEAGARRGRYSDRAGEEGAETPTYNIKRYEDNPRIKKTNRKEAEDDGTIRLNRYIANAGVCSRREADALIEAGEIKVNGQVVTEMGYKVAPSDTVQYGKQILSREKQVYVLLNKPKDFITTTEDPEGRKTVMDLVAKASKERIFPVGRLDRNTTGLLLFTNDGELAQKLTHPSNEIKKIYQVELDKPITKEDFEKIVEGLELEDGKAQVDDLAIVGDSNRFLGIEIHIGRNRIVRRIFEHLGYDVVALDRVQYAGLTKKDLPRGNWRYLSEKELVRLKYFV